MFYVFPAGAGVIPQTTNRKSTLISVSRRRGGDPRLAYAEIAAFMCFPQARG